MATQRQELVTQQFNFVPTTLKEAQDYAMIFAESGLCPEAYRGRPNDILVIWKMGQELGLDKMQALRTLGCINGMPFAYGDGLLALVKRHPDYEDMQEWFEGSIEAKNLTAYCTMKRKGKKDVTQSFSMNDAKDAGLWDKKGVWQQYKRRMLQHRARGFCAKDTFPDALYGLKSEYEAKDIADSQVVVEMPKPKNKGMAGLEESLGIQSEPQILEGEIIQVESEIIEEDKFDLKDMPNIPETETINEEFLKLIKEKKVPDRSIQKWCKQFDATVIDDINIEAKKAIINHLKTMESK